ncbi:type II toxin-antitoxin system VapC family toxin [candidate division WOR-3 bacterium]|nr:type II toxin-antitoxin system VapC family toxin [candidate division WOR-3 bacterium]
MKVLDASVVLKWFLKEGDSEEAIKLKNEIVMGTLSVAIPDLILYELSNALRYKKGYTSEIVIEAIDAILDLNADIIVPTKSLIEEAIKIAYSKGISIYDASHIALAKSLGYSFITADVKLYNAIKNMHIAELL